MRMMTMLTIFFCIGTSGLLFAQEELTYRENMRALGKEVNKMSRLVRANDFSEETVKTAEKIDSHVDRAASEYPSSIEDLPEGEEKESQKVKYDDLMSELKVESQELISHAKNADQDACQANLKNMNRIKREGHRLFR